ncbi:MAG: hypothetical protein JRE23_11805 [Deltaproteobacteria bacterium]|nr:hypothetical protein [Deltaproteobacteria bacterium]
MNRDNNVEQTCDLPGLLEGKLDAFKSFLSVTALLRNAADLQETEKIETLIAKRENCMKVIGEIDGRINRIRNSIPALPGGAVERVRAITKAIDDTVAAAACLNKEFETIFTFHHNNLKDRLSKTRHSRDGIKNYALGACGENQPRFLDVKS